MSIIRGTARVVLMIVLGCFLAQQAEAGSGSFDKGVSTSACPSG